MSDAFGSLLRSRKFMLLLLDTVVSLLTFFVGKYATPATAQDLLTVIGILQPVFVMMIYSIALEDSAEKGATIFYKDVTPEPCEEPK